MRSARLVSMASASVLAAAVLAHALEGSAHAQYRSSGLPSSDEPTASGAPAGRPFELAPFAGYQAGPSFGIDPGKATIGDAPVAGATAVGWFRGEVGSAFTYQFSPASLTFSDPSLPKIEHLGVHHAHLSAVYQRYFSRAFRLYGGVGLGATVLHAQDQGDEWFWSFSVGGGFSWFFAKHVGIQGDIRALIPFRVTDGGFFCSSARGCVGVISGGTAILQMAFTAGPVFTF